METIPVHIPAISPHTYEVRIGSNLLRELGPLVKSLAPAPTAAIVTDSTVAPLYLRPVAESLQQAGYRVLQHIIPAGEQHKTLATASAAMDTFLNAKVERATPVIALGGGVVGDLAGLVSATLLRGTPFIQVPTTLLSAVDASVGGKVGVDHPAGKNLIGAFHQPRLVLTDTQTFSTLPNREVRAGLAECIKHGVIRDPDLFAFIAANIAKFAACDTDALTTLVARNVAIKAAIVAEDPFEKSVRALLNFGHTFAHAIENVLHYSMLHGEAVALGMVAAGRLATTVNNFPAEELEKLINLIDYAGLPTSHPELNVDQTMAAMWTDKKVKSGKIRFVLPTRIGHAQVYDTVDEKAVRCVINSLKDPPIPAACKVE